MNHEEIVEIFKDKYEYNPETGIVTYAKDHCRSKKGDRAGHIGTSGYTILMIDGQRYYLHRLVYLVMTGNWPKGFIDHKDGDKLNNKWENLRGVTRTINSRNRKRSRSNTSGYNGVSWEKSRKKWQVHISVNSKQISLGLFDFIEDAILARIEAEILYWGEDGRQQQTTFDR